MHRDVRDALSRHQASIAAEAQARLEEVAAVQDDYKAKLAAMEAAHNARMEQQHSESEAALQNAQAELAEVIKQAAAAVASRPEAAQHIKVRGDLQPGGARMDACMCVCKGSLTPTPGAIVTSCIIWTAYNVFVLTREIFAGCKTG